MKQIALSIEQMHHLKELGVDTSDACMLWFREVYVLGMDESTKSTWYLSLFKHFEDTVDVHFEVNPAYTLEDIWEKLPNFLKTKKTATSPIINYYKTLGSHYCGYYSEDGEDVLMSFNGDALETTYKLLCWVALKYSKTLK